MNKAGTLEEMFEIYLAQAESTPFSGWNFEYTTKTKRMVEAPLKWNYYNVVLPWLRKAQTMLDMGTGGGEALSGFAPLPPTTYATEQYKPNVPVARERLEPLGVKVIEVDEEKKNNESLPFDDEFFDMIICRHESYFAKELIRILKPGGIFITQQEIGGIGVLNLTQFLTEKNETVVNGPLKNVVGWLKSAGFRILEQQEDTQFYRYYDVGAVAYYLKAIPWSIEDFTIDKYKDRLWELHIRINENGFYETPLRRFIIVAQK